jgi:inner membrane protein
MVPVVGFLAALPWLAFKRYRGMWQVLVWAGILGVLSHVLLDACTSYGTQLLWPFSGERFAGDWIAVIDPAFSLPILAGLVWSLWKKRARGARVALVFAALYMGLAVVQHERAAAVQREVAAARGQVMERGRVLPVVGTINGYRSVYVAGGVLYADAVRVPFYSRGVVRQGMRVEVLKDGAAGADAEARRELGIFEKFADGYVARVPGRPDVVGDMRYSIVSDRFDPPWGVQVEPLPVKWVTFAEWSGRNWGAIWREMVGAGKWERVERR